MYNLPNMLTISRILVIPLIFVSVFNFAPFNTFAWAMFAGALFIAASITDYLDGYLARAWNQTSAFGRLLDPIADKLLVATALVVILVKPDMYSWNYTVIAVFVILCREILVSGLREFLREVNVGLPVTKLAKWKTTFQMTALAMMLFKDLWIWWGFVGEVLLWVAAVLTFITGYQYYQRSLDYVKEEEERKRNPIKKMASAVKAVAEKMKGKSDTSTKTKSTQKTRAFGKKA